MAYRRNRHPILQGRTGWVQEAVGVVKGYPKTQEAYDALCSRLSANRARAREAGLLTSTNIPKGWSGRKQELVDIREHASDLAGRAVVYLLPEYEAWDDRAVTAVTELFAMALDPSLRVDLRIKAVGVALEFIQPKPVTRQQMKANGRECHLNWLYRLATR
jgi:hypothetical protein